MTISSTEVIVAELRAGRMVILIDEEGRENEGDIVLAADFVTPEAINFMATHARGLICLALTEALCDRLELPTMAANNGTAFGTNFTVSIEAATGVTTGISAADRARTVQVAVAEGAISRDLVRPGHIFPLRAQRGGVLMRAGHTEAGCDLTAMAGLTPASVICEVLNEDGSMARLPDLLVFAAKHDLKIGTIADLIHHRHKNESLVERVGERSLRTAQGDFLAIAFRDKPGAAAHLALVHGDLAQDAVALVRVHESVSLMDFLETGQCSLSWTIPASLQAIKASACGVLVLLNCGEGAAELFTQLAVPDTPEVTLRAGTGGKDVRSHGVGAQILRDIGVGKMILLANPHKLPPMTGFDLDVLGVRARSAANCQ